MRSVNLGIVGLVMLLAIPDSRADILWNEAVDGDLSQSPQLSPLLPVVVGNNIVMGNTGFVTGIPDYDGFRLHVGSGLEIISASLSLAPTVGSPIDVTWFFCHSDYSNGTNAYRTIPSSGSILNSIMPLRPGDYFIQDTTLGAAVSGSYFDYQFSFMVVPEPSTFVLLATAAFGLSAYAWRRRRAAA
jgi:hypothetical protein